MVVIHIQANEKTSKYIMLKLQKITISYSILLYKKKSAKSDIHIYIVDIYLFYNILLYASKLTRVMIKSHIFCEITSIYIYFNIPRYTYINYISMLVLFCIFYLFFLLFS